MNQYLPAELRDHVQQRTRQRCEYCLLHEEDSMLSHEIDHIVSRKHRGQTAEDNLAWTCFLCNRFKGSDIASIDVETGSVVPLIHPRIDTWNEHFRLVQGRILPLTPKGRVTEYLLQFNLPDSVETRSLLVQAGRYPS